MTKPGENNETVQVAKAFYDAKLKSQFEPEHIGKFLVWASAIS